MESEAYGAQVKCPVSPRTDLQFSCPPAEGRGWAQHPHPNPSGCRGGLPGLQAASACGRALSSSVPAAGMWKLATQPNSASSALSLLLSASQYPVLNPFCFKHSCTVWTRDAVMRYFPNIFLLLLCSDLAPLSETTGLQRVRVQDHAR